MVGETKADADGGTNRREVLAAGGAAMLALSLRYTTALGEARGTQQPYGRWEDLMRKKWTWDRVVRGTHGTNCTGNCAFNVYVKNGIVWREEQQGEYGRSEDAPDYGPRGCQKGLRHAKYMYGKQRVLYPMKRVGRARRGQVGARQLGPGDWPRSPTASSTHYVAFGPRSISFDLGTQMVLKRASFAALGRFATVTGIEMPEAFAGVGDLPTGVLMTVGEPLLGDTMAAVFKSQLLPRLVLQSGGDAHPGRALFLGGAATTAPRSSPSRRNSRRPRCTRASG